MERIKNDGFYNLVGRLLTSVRGEDFRRAAPALVVFFLLTLGLLNASCRRSGETGNQDAAANANAQATIGATAGTPPFATKEPERYQAVRIETASDGAETLSRRTLIARDGERRREDYEMGAGTVSYLQLPGGVYVLLPERKLYAELKPEASRAQQEITVPPDFSPEKLLNGARPESRYERLGEDVVNGRATVKYRVTLMGRTGPAKELTAESLVWVDESLGMPVKSETIGAGGAKAMIELREITEAVDEKVFELPADYQKVEFRELAAQLPTAK